MLSTANIRKRLAFATKFKDFDFTRVIFSDEKIFRMKPGHRVRCWRKDGDKFKAKCVMPVVSKSEGIMVWCAINGHGDLIIRKCPKTMKSADYTDTILETALNFIAPRYAPTFQNKTTLFTIPRATRYLFQQDGAPCHKSAHTTQWLKDKQVRMLNKGDWPPCSPDLNPVEHIWPYVNRALEGMVFANKNELWDELQKAFAAISPDTVLNLYNSMSRRMAAVMVANGGHTKY